MPESNYLEKTKKPNTISSLYSDFRNLGIIKGDTILIHSSLSALGFTAGNALSIIEALIKTVGLEGNIIMPSFSGENSNPAHWKKPPVPESWWETIRNESPAFDPSKTPSLMMGIIAETFRSYPGVIRSAHPQNSFTAFGPKAEFITKDHQLTPAFGGGSPMEKNFELDGKLLLLGVDHSNNSTLHYADWKADYPSKGFATQGTAMFVDGKRKWVEFTDLEYEDDDFLELGNEYEASQPFIKGLVGIGVAKIFPARNFIDFAKKWFEKNRKFKNTVKKA